MITAKFLKDMYVEARPVLERRLDDADILVGFRDAMAAHGGDWASFKALITADIKDGRDETGDGKRVKKILDKADYSAAYADMLGLAKMNERNISADEDYDPETGEVIKPNAPRPSKRDVSTNGKPYPEAGPQAEASHVGTESGTPAVQEDHSEGAVTAERSVSAAPVRKPDMEIPAFLVRTKPPPELVE